VSEQVQDALSVGVVTRTPASLAETSEAVLVATSMGENAGVVIEIIEGESHRP
jgi:hypothetical protein